MTRRENVDVFNAMQPRRTVCGLQNFCIFLEKAFTFIHSPHYDTAITKLRTVKDPVW